MQVRISRLFEERGNDGPPRAESVSEVKGAADHDKDDGSGDGQRQSAHQEAHGHRVGQSAGHRTTKERGGRMRVALMVIAITAPLEVAGGLIERVCDKD